MSAYSSEFDVRVMNCSEESSQGGIDYQVSRAVDADPMFRTNKGARRKNLFFCLAQFGLLLEGGI